MMHFAPWLKYQLIHQETPKYYSWSYSTEFWSGMKNANAMLFLSYFYFLNK